MKSNLLISLPLLGVFALASCYPIQGVRNRRGGPVVENQPEKKETVASNSQQKIREKRDDMKEKEQSRKRETASVPKEKPKTTTTTSTSKPAEKKGDYSFANPVPGKEGFVFSPYNNKLVDVRDIPSGTLVQDPTYPAAEKKYFRVP